VLSRFCGLVFCLNFVSASTFLLSVYFLSYGIINTVAILVAVVNVNGTAHQNQNQRACFLLPAAAAALPGKVPGTATAVFRVFTALFF
jgi:hypothetical protein